MPDLHPLKPNSAVGVKMTFEIVGTIEVGTGDDLLEARRRVEAALRVLRRGGDLPGDIKCVVAVLW